MKKFTPITMKCTQEDWESIKDKLEGIYSCISSFKEREYLIDDWFGTEKVSNVSKQWVIDNAHNVEIYEKFDANIFLNACGIDYYEVVKSEKPTHYQTDVDFDVIDFCNSYDLNFNRGSVVKYVARAGKKDDEIKDLEKALDFIQREIKYLKEK